MQEGLRARRDAWAALAATDQAVPGEDVIDGGGVWPVNVGPLQMKEVEQLASPPGRKLFAPSEDALDEERICSRGAVVRPSRMLIERGRTDAGQEAIEDRKSTRLNSSHSSISYAVF